MRFEKEGFVGECRAAVGPQAVRELVARAVAEPGVVLDCLGQPQRGGVGVLHRSDELTILNVIWAPAMSIMPHDHRMWAVIGVYSGREDNIFWQRMSGNQRGRIEAQRARALCEREVVVLAPDIIHSVLNPISRFSCAIHVYGGDFFAASRSEWDPESLLERAYDVEAAMRRLAAPARPVN